MKLIDFTAEPDLVGRRIILSFTFTFSESETLAMVPPIIVRRKLRNFEFMPLVANDSTLVYDSANFPNGGGIVSEIPGWEEQENGRRHATTVESVSQSVNGQQIEVRRRTKTTTFDLNNQLIQQRVSILDTGLFPGELVPGNTYYYQISSPLLSLIEDQSPYRATATATESYALARRLYEMLPNVYRRHDVRARPVTPGAAAIPEAASQSGQLRRFTDLFGVGLDYLRSRAEGLLNLHDIDNVSHQYLPLLANWIGWDLNFDASISVQRNEIKNASSLYKDIGNIPNLRALVNYYTGWYSQVAEFSQSLVRSNHPAQLNLFAIAQTNSGWRSPNEGALELGFEPGNDSATGTVNTPAVLNSTHSEPFVLRPGMLLQFKINQELPVTVQFWSEDFENIRRVTAADVSRVLNRLLYNVEAIPLADGRVSLRTYRRGSGASIEVGATPPELVTLEGAPTGKLATIVDPQGRIRLFYDAIATAVDVSSEIKQRIRTKTYTQGEWRDSQPVEFNALNAGSPSVVAVPTGEIWYTWLEAPGTSNARIMTATATSRLPQPAQLAGTLSEPFINLPGGTITFRLNHTDIQTVTFQSSDFVQPQAATAVEVASVLNAQLTGIQTTVQPDRSLRIVTTGLTAEQLAIELGNSTIARQLGFGSRNMQADGYWDDTLDWDQPQVLPTVDPGRHADVNTLLDAAGVIWLFWSTHNGVHWQLMTARWDGNSWSQPEVLSSEFSHYRDPHAVLDHEDNIWLFWSQSLTGESWSLQRQIFNPDTSSWSSATAVAPDVADVSVADREPAAVLVNDSVIRLFFRSNRAGGVDLWSMDIQAATGTADPPQPISQTGDANCAPAPVVLANDRLWLLYRSDQSLPPAQFFGQRSLEPTDNVILPFRQGKSETASQSTRLADTGTLQHFHGSISVRLNDARRQHRIRRWNDLLTYTPQQVDIVSEMGALVGGSLYTPNTVGIYISRTQQTAALNQRNVERLRQVLERSIPLNMRAVVILAPPVDVEYIYEAGTSNTIQDTYSDDYPFVEYYSGLIDQTVDTLPDWLILLSNTPDRTSVDLSDLTSLRSRSFFPGFDDLT